MGAKVQDGAPSHINIIVDHVRNTMEHYLNLIFDTIGEYFLYCFRGTFHQF